MAGASYPVQILVLIGMIITVTVDAQSMCYSCFDAASSTSGNCLVTTNQTRQSDCSNRGCMTSFTYIGSDVRIARECADQSTCTNCTDPRNCNHCCNETTLCNGVAYETLAERYRISQPCYQCSYSEIPGASSTEGCGTDFDDNFSAIQVVHCPGLCGKATTTINGLVNEVTRYCAPYAGGCDGDTNLISRGGSLLSFQTTCCKGPRCNSARQSSSNLATLVFGLIVGFPLTLIVDV